MISVMYRLPLMPLAWTNSRPLSAARSTNQSGWDGAGEGCRSGPHAAPTATSRSRLKAPKPSRRGLCARARLRVTNRLQREALLAARILYQPGVGAGAEHHGAALGG